MSWPLITALIYFWSELPFSLNDLAHLQAFKAQKLITYASAGPFILKKKRALLVARKPSSLRPKNAFERAE